MNARQTRHFLLLVVMGMLSSLPPPASGRTLRVMRDGTGDYTTIQPAVDAASPGDTILVGPGRYTEHTPFWPGASASQNKSWPLETYVAVSVDSLTIRGVAHDQVVIGPTEPYYTVDDQLGFANLAVGKALTIQNLQVENLFNGGYLFGKINIENCLFRACNQGVVYWSRDGMTVFGCEFVSNTTGVVTFNGAANPTVANCMFLSNGFGVDFVWTSNGIVMGCTFTNDVVGVQLEQGSTGAIIDSRIDSINGCISIIAPSTAVITNNTCTGHAGVSAMFDGEVIATGNIFQGGDVFTIGLCTGVAQINGNHILKGAGLAVKVRCPVVPPLRDLNFANNYWGTSSADSIRAWIVDHADDSNLYGQVNFEPFSPTPLPTEKKSLGGVKLLYR